MLLLWQQQSGSGSPVDLPVKDLPVAQPRQKWKVPERLRLYGASKSLEILERDSKAPQ